ncbi:MAG: pyridoxamine 5-phosphate oxidase [Microbacteriaceae bacterium]|nr:pyridoxamine 5-phosphate oxidase [Microbacteriaceae bacterium]
MSTQQNSVDEWSPQGPVTELSDEQCWLRLDGFSFGRLGVSLDNQPEIFPVDYAADGASILFRTADGTKLRELVANSSVVFEADAQTADSAWSVTVKGRAHVLDLIEEIEVADQQVLPDWHPTRPFVYVRIVPSEIHGRQFRRGPLISEI